MINDSLLQRAYADLRSLVEPDHVPVGVKAAAFRLSECQTKLFRAVFVQESAVGAADGAIRFEPSNRLLELLKALKAFEWPQFIVLVHDTISDDAFAFNAETASPELGGY